MSEEALTRQLDRNAALVGWCLASALAALTWFGWEATLGTQRAWLAAVAAGLFVGTWILHAVLPAASRAGLVYAPEDKALAASLLQITAISAWLFLRVEPLPAAPLLYALPIAAATMVLHPRVVLAETVFSVAALGFLKAAAWTAGPPFDAVFAVEIGIFAAYGFAMAVLAGKLRQTLRRAGQLTDELSKRLDQMQVVGVLVRQVEFFTQFDTLLDRTAEIVAGAFDAERYGTFLFDPDRPERIALRGQSYGFGPSERELLSVESNLEAFLEVAKDRRARIFSSEEMQGRYGVLSGQARIFNMMAVPLKARRGVIGVAFVANKRRGGFGEDDLSYFEMLAGYISTLVDSAELFQRVVNEQRTVEKMARLMVGRELRMRELKQQGRNPPA